MKYIQKTLIYSLILAVLTLPSLSRAQVVASISEEDKASIIAEIKLELASYIKQLIEIYQQQINDMLAAQNQTISGLSKKVDTLSSRVDALPVPTPGLATAPAPQVDTVDIFFNRGQSTTTAGDRQELIFSPASTFRESDGSCPTFHLVTDDPDGFLKIPGTGTTTDWMIKTCNTDMVIEARTPGNFSIGVSVEGTSLAKSVPFTVN